MKRLGITSLLSGLIVFASCGGDQGSGDRPQQITDEPLTQREVEPDSTLQPVMEVSIRTIEDAQQQSMSFDQDTIKVKVGTLVRLTFTNEGEDPKMIYNLVFTKDGYSAQVAQKGGKAGASGNYLPDSSLLLAATPLALPGQKVKVEFVVPDTAGVFEYVNTYPSKSPLMKGKLIVEE